MTEEEFWEVIEAGHRGASGFEERLAAVTRELLKQSPQEVLEFDCIFWRRIDDAYRADLWDAAALAGGGCGDDGFEYFLRWLVSRGRRAYAAVLDNPDTLVDWIDGEDDIFFEQFGWVASEAYRRKTGRELHDDSDRRAPTAPAEPAARQGQQERLALRGEFLRGEVELERHLPRL
jgi:hypothetical protein